MESQDLKQAGLKVTLSRMKILELLESSGKKHMSAEDIYKALLDVGKDIGLATIYRVLTQFQAAGLVIRHHFDGGQAVFELARGSHHDHLICLKCGKIVEFVDESIEAKQDKIAEEHGFKIEDHSLIIYGVCSNENCQR